jgi:MerR family redox-sensitive transcriptional activator SoxR
MNPPWEPILSIRDVVRRSGVAASALRFYEERGLIAPDRAPSAQRRYHRSVLRRLAFIVFAQRIGLSLDEIATELARLPAGPVPRRHQWATLSAAWTARIDARIAELGRLRDSLAECIGCGCMSLDRCRLANPLDRASLRGSGPRYWLGDRRRGR